MADEGIDPRYAAQFQRGFDPAVHAALPIPASPSASTRESPVRLPGGPPASAPRIGQPPPRVEQRPPETEAPPLGSSPPQPPVDEPARRPPFLEWGLLVAGVVLLAAAAALFWQSTSDLAMYLGASTPGEQTVATIRNSLPGPLLVGAVTAWSAWVVLRAVRGPEQ